LGAAQDSRPCAATESGLIQSRQSL
jgi:hypothetical protein